jgi:hypothetical protein
VRFGRAYVKSMRMGASDVLDRGLHLTGLSRDPLEIVIGDAGTLSGTVQTTRQEPVLNSTAVVVPDAPDRHRADLFKRAVTDSAGRFRIRDSRRAAQEPAWEDIGGSWQDSRSFAFTKIEARRSGFARARRKRPVDGDLGAMKGIVFAAIW